MKYDTVTFIKKAKEIHNNKYDYSLTTYIKSNIKIKINCPEHGIFEQTPVSHIRNNKPRGCPLCSGKNKTTKQFIIEANKVHNNKYDYSKVNYINSLTLITIICPTHGEFMQKPSSHLSGWGCKACGGNNKLTTNEFIKNAIKIHENKYDYSLVKYINSHNKIEIICPKHGIFKQKPNNHLSGQECYHCSKVIQSNNKIIKGRNNFITKANKVHNNKYDYSKVNYINSSTLITIICPTHGEFMQRVNTHLSGHGCPNCNKSKGELCIEYHLLKNNISYISQKTFNDCIGDNKKLKFDFYLPQYNILIEYDGKQHFTPINYFGGIKSYLMTKKYDEIKNKYAGDNNIKLIRISYESFDLIEKIILENII